MSTRLSVNLNAIAMLRNRRDLPWPDLLYFANIALAAGAHGITVHPRPDQRHIRFSDIETLSCFIKEKFSQAEFNIEGYPSSKFLALALPYADQITLVPDSPEQKTSDHGWDFKKSEGFLTDIYQQIKQHKIRVSVFADPESEDLELVKKIGIERVEFYTGPYALSHFFKENFEQELARLVAAIQTAHKLGLEVNAGHDLTLDNLAPLIKASPALKEVSIGHALTVDALEYGMKATIERFLTILQ